MLACVYIVYLVISIAMTVWVGHTLHANGRVFLVQRYKGDEALADSVNRLLQVGFYLVSTGFIFLTLAAGRGVNPDNLQEAIEILSLKQGVIILVLGCMYFFNVYVLYPVTRQI